VVAGSTFSPENQSAPALGRHIGGVGASVSGLSGGAGDPPLGANWQIGTVSAVWHKRNLGVITSDGVSYVLQKLSGPNVRLGFNTEKGLSHLAEDRQDNATRVVIAQVGK
jgi:hypothetical protein